MLVLYRYFICPMYIAEIFDLYLFCFFVGLIMWTWRWDIRPIIKSFVGPTYIDFDFKAGIYFEIPLRNTSVYSVKSSCFSDVCREKPSFYDCFCVRKKEENYHVTGLLYLLIYSYFFLKQHKPYCVYLMDKGKGMYDFCLESSNTFDFHEMIMTYFSTLRYWVHVCWKL